MKTETSPKPVALLVTTAHKGVFFGYGQSSLTETVLRLECARMCVYWSADVKGMLGLAATGPSKSCKIGPEAPAIVVRDITAIVEVSPQAEEQWQKGYWN